MGGIYILTGEIQSGKTSLCLALVKEARKMGIQLGGLISPGVFRSGEKIAIDLLDIKSDERKRLADGLGGRSTEVHTKRWSFQPDAVAWGNRILDKSVPCDLLLIDELGPLEFLRGEGWVKGFKAVDSDGYQAALLVIRPSLVEEALNRWEVNGIIDLGDPDQPINSGEKLISYILGSS